MSDTYSTEVPVGGTAPPPEPAADIPGLPDRSGEMSKIASEQAAVQRDKVAATDAVIGQVTSIQNRMLPKIEALANKVGVEAENLKPWDADAETAKRRTDPIAAFGSLGSVFGILASTFTNQPMANALDASAAAMGAIKANDDQAYDRAYKAWQDNAKMAMDRHKIQRDAYQDAVSLMNTNTTAALTKMQLLAARFGDKQMQVLLENGLSKEAIELVNARDRLGFEMQQNYPKMVIENEKMRDLLQDPRMKLPPGDPQRAIAVREHADRWAGRSASADEIWTAQWVQENPDGTSEKFTKDYGAFRQAQSGGSLANANLTPERQRAQDILKKRQEWEAETNPDGTPKYTSEQIANMASDYERQLKQKAAPTTGNRVDDLKSLYDRAGMMSGTIDKVEDLLAKHKALTGVGGQITRPAEVVSNWFGSNETDRAQFRRYISELQEWGTRVLNESKGRPLSAEVAKLNNILPGLSAGDTTANTVRAYRELKPLIATIQQQLQKRIEGTWQPGAVTPPAAPTSAPWLRDKVIGPGKQSAIENDTIPTNATLAQGQSPFRYEAAASVLASMLNVDRGMQEKGFRRKLTDMDMDAARRISNQFRRVDDEEDKRSTRR